MSYDYGNEKRRTIYIIICAMLLQYPTLKNRNLGVKVVKGTLKQTVLRM